ncbi:MAG: hypothetical protein H6981_01370 [Gammaproteobacteria bacterium]|nr:hypothetical protein [Gammaproteobacteria bacterium]MCP5135436.1 hypothetical protein [Gammaproteobacteria bacterium]
MDVYKLHQSDIGFQTISKEEFEAGTHKNPPWYPETESGSPQEQSPYAVCPGCDNPIQIIGLYKLPKGVTRPYARHANHSVPGLADLDVERRACCCPYYQPRPHHPASRRARLDGVARKILTTLIEQFDRVVYLLEKDTGVRFSRQHLRKMLTTYRYWQGYLYTGATLTNVPWIFAYMSNAQSLFNQRVDADSDLGKAILAGVPDANIDARGHIVNRVHADGHTRFFQLSVCFIHHTQAMDADQGLIETMKMRVFSDTGLGLEKAPVLFEKVIAFDPAYFQNLIGLPADRAKRRPDLVAVARDVLGDLCDEA